MQTLTSLSEEPHTEGRCAAPEELEGPQGASPVRTSPAEPLNVALLRELSSSRIGEEGSRVLAASQTGAELPTTEGIHYLVPLRWHRRQLHRLQPAKGGGRGEKEGRRDHMLGLKKGTLVKHIKYGLCYVGENLKERFSLHSLRTGRRRTQEARREEFTVLTRVTFRTQFLPPINSGVSLGD